MDDDASATNVFKNFSIERGKPSGERPWCWQEKEALKMIRTYLGETDDGSSVRSVYLALTEFASDFQKGSFTVSVTQIAERAMVGKTTVNKALHALEQLGLVRIERQTIGGFKSASIYSITEIGKAMASTLPMTVKRSSMAAGEESRLGDHTQKESEEPREREAVELTGDAMRQRELEALAATATDSKDLCGKLQPFFPRLNVRVELKRCDKYRRDRSLSQTTTDAFLSWLANAKDPIPRSKPATNQQGAPSIEAPVAASAHLGKQLAERFRKFREAYTPTK